MEDNIQKAATLDGEVPSHEIFNQLVQAFAEKSKDVFRSYLYAEECKKVQNEEFYNLFLEISNDEKDEAIKLLEMTNMAKYDGCL
jgi:rubrerythrin